MSESSGESYACERLCCQLVACVLRGCSVQKNSNKVQVNDEKRNKHVLAVNVYLFTKSRPNQDVCEAEIFYENDTCAFETVSETDKCRYKEVVEDRLRKRRNEKIFRSGACPATFDINRGDGTTLIVTPDSQKVLGSGGYAEVFQGTITIG